MVHGGGTRNNEISHSSGVGYSRGNSRSQSSSSRGQRFFYQPSRRQRGNQGGIFSPRISNNNHYHLHTPLMPRNTHCDSRIVPSSAHVEEGFANNTSRPSDDNLCSGCKCCCCCCSVLGTVFAACKHTSFLSVFLSLVIFGILLATSSQDERWILNAGESRRIEPPSLTKAVNMKVEWDSHQDGVDVSVYTLRKCPALTGPPTFVSHQNSITLNRGEYQYDYYYLNQGSTMSASFTQAGGSSEVLLLRGRDMLRSLDGSDTDWQSINQRASFKWYIYSHGRSKTINFQAEGTDIYILLYENVSNSVGQLHMEYTMKLANYNLEDRTPICSDAVARKGCPPIETRGAGCIIVDTTPGSSSDDEGEVSLRITNSRCWSSVILWSILPSALCFAYALYTRARQYRQAVRTSGNGDDETQALLPPVPTTPGQSNDGAPTAPTEAVPTDPPTAPVNPTAPPSELDGGSSLPLAQAEVIVESEEGTTEAASAQTIEIPIDQIDPIPAGGKK